MGRRDRATGSRRQRASTRAERNMFMELDFHSDMVVTVTEGPSDPVGTCKETGAMGGVQILSSVQLSESRQALRLRRGESSSLQARPGNTSVSQEMPCVGSLMAQSWGCRKCTHTAWLCGARGCGTCMLPALNTSAAGCECSAMCVEPRRPHSITRSSSFSLCHGPRIVQQ